MAETVPAVRGETLLWREGDEECLITVGTPAWYAWLTSAAKFSFVGARGSFTAYKEPRERGGWYWKAYRRCSGKLRRAYLGKTELLSAARLEAVASELESSCGGTDRPPRAGEPDGAPSSPIHREAGHSATLGSTLPDHRIGSDPTDALLHTKLSPPLPPSDLVPRPRLIEQLSAGLRHKLVLISAPAGFGKTTLISQWCQNSDFPFAWLSLDATENDPTRFWAYLVAALQTACPGLGAEALAMLRAPHAPPVQSFLAVLGNEITATVQELVLVLDDYHLINDPGIHAGMTFLLDHLPPPLHLVIVSRADPPLPLARLRGRRQLYELRADQMSFTREESTTFLNEVMQLGISADDVAALDRHTEGWAVGLQMAGLSLRGCHDSHAFVAAFTGDHRYVVDYLVEEVLRRQPEHIQRFLLHTAILDRMSGPLCEAVALLGPGEGQAVLEALETANLFTVALDDGRRWYRYHHLFADCLKGRLQRIQPGREPELHRRACAWLAHQGLMVEAVSHALSAGEWEQAADLMESECASMVSRAETTTISSWLRVLPEEILRTRPFLCTSAAHTLVSSGELDAAEARLLDAERSLGPRANVAVGRSMDGIDAPAYDEQRPEAQRVRNHILTVRSAIAANRRDLSLTIAVSRQALEHPFGEDEYLRAIVLLDLGTAYRWTGDLPRASEALAEAVAVGSATDNKVIAVLAASQLANVQTVQGRLREACETFQRGLGLALGRDGRLLTVAGRPSLGLALLHYEWNDLASAARLAAEGTALIEQAAMWDILALGHGVRARLKQAAGDVAGALEVMARAEDLALAHNLRQELARITIYRVRLWLAQGNLEAARGWAASSGLRVDDELSYLREAGHLMLARVLIACGRPAESAPLLSRLLADTEQGGRMGSAIKVLAVLALAEQALGNTSAALQNLGRALALAEPAGYVRTFLDEGPPMVALLSKFLEGRLRGQQRTVPPGYLHGLLVARAYGAGRRPGEEGIAPISPLPLVLLSKREIEVLRLIADGSSPDMIARALVVSPNTIKTHYRNIYGKLGAHTATEALAKARALQLL